MCHPPWLCKSPKIALSLNSFLPAVALLSLGLLYYVPPMYVLHIIYTYVGTYRDGLLLCQGRETERNPMKEMKEARTNISNTFFIPLVFTQRAPNSHMVH